MWHSDCSDLSYGETLYSLNELQTMRVINNTIAKWINDNPLSPDEPILLLEYDDQAIADRGDEICQALTANGGNSITSTVFQFAKNDDVYLAREEMKETHTWAFYEPRGILVPGRLFNHNQPGLFVVLRQAPTISTKIIHFHSVSKFTLEKEYKFFEW